MTSQSAIYFGAQQFQPLSVSKGNVTVSTPPGLPGPVDVYTYANDGGVQIVPEAFSYGPTILQVSPDTSPAGGGGTGLIYGYGLVPLDATTIPPDLKVSLGGTNVQILGFSPNAYGAYRQPPVHLLD